MTIPMIVLGALSLVGGYLLIFGGGVQHWLTPSVGPSLEEGVHTVNPTVLSILTLVVIALGAYGAYVAFARKPVPEERPVAVSPVTRVARKNIFADAFNEAVLMRPGQWLSRALVYVDNGEWTVRSPAWPPGWAAARHGCGVMQTGFVRSYALSMLAGTVAVLAVLLAVRFQ